jgi:hypothetical protein
VRGSGIERSANVEIAAALGGRSTFYSDREQNVERPLGIAAISTFTDSRDPRPGRTLP